MCRVQKKLQIVYIKLLYIKKLWYIALHKIENLCKIFYITIELFGGIMKNIVKG